MAQESLIEGILRSLGCNRRQAFLIIAFSLLLTTLINRHFPPTYESTALLRILSSEETSGENLAASMNGILSQNQTLQDVCTACGIDPSAALAQEMFSLEDGGGGLVKLVVKNYNPRVLQSLGDSLIKTLSDRFLRYNDEANSLEIQSLDRKKTLLLEKLEASKNEVSSLKTSQLQAASPEALALEDDANAEEAKIKELRKQQQVLPRIKVVSSRELTSSFSQTANALSESRASLFELLKTYREKHPKIIHLAGQIDRLEARLKGFSRVRDHEQLNPEFESIQKNIEARETKLRQIRDRLNAFTSETASEGVSNIELEALVSRQKSLEGLYAGVLMKLEDLKLKQSTSVGQIQVINKDREIPRPMGLSEIQRQVVGLLSGALMAIFLLYTPVPIKAELVGAAASALMGGGTPKIEIERIQALMQIPALNTIRLALPQPDLVCVRPHDDRLLVLNDPESPRLGPYRTLCSNLQVAISESGTRIILVCSARNGMGRTTLSANLAILFAQAGYSVVLVDGNLRKPALHRVFDLENYQGLTTALCGGGGINLVQQTSEKNLGILTCGPLPPRPSELLGSAAMIDLLDRLKRRVELVMIDTPGLLDAPDAGIMASQAGGVVFLHREGEPESDICASRDFLKSIRAKVLGYVKT